MVFKRFHRWIPFCGSAFQGRRTVQQFSGPETGQRKRATRKPDGKLTRLVNLWVSWHEKLTLLVTHFCLHVLASPFQGRWMKDKRARKIFALWALSKRGFWWSISAYPVCGSPFQGHRSYHMRNHNRNGSYQALTSNHEHQLRSDAAHHFFVGVTFTKLLCL